MNKKIITIIVAAILALIAAVFIFNKPKTLPPVVQEEVQEVQTVVDEQQAAPEVEPTKPMVQPEKKKVIKKKAAPVAKKTSKPEIKVEPDKIQEAEVQITEPVKEISVDLDKENGDIVVLKELRSENYYKHKYTPARYKK